MTIKEVSDKFGLTPDTLRFYEKKGLIGPVNKTEGGIRNYGEKDLSRIEFIKCMKDAGIPLDVLKKYFDLFEMGDSTLEERKNLLKKQRIILKEKIDKMNDAYKKLNYKIDLFYEGKLDEYMNKMNELNKK